ncbi:MAG TPA: hypothetical protein VIV40_30165 [Kofleriaceae bacterium]
MRVWVLAVVLCACGDDISLRVSVEHPAGVTVALTNVTVYESASLTCIDVAFARIGGDELDAVKVSEEAVANDGTVSGGLTGISRVDHKVIVARGYSDTGAWITAGCAEQDVVDEATKITITTVPTVIAATVLDNDPSDPYLAVLATTDPTGKAVANRRVAWTVYGPAGSSAIESVTVSSPSDATWEPTKASCTQASGAATLHPPPANIVGGYAVQLRAEWAIELPSMYSRFIASFGAKMIAPPNQSKKYCAIRKKGTMSRIVCLDNGVARDFEVTVAAGQVSLVQRDMTTLGSEALDVVSVASGTDRDVYMMSTRGALIPLFGAPAPDNSAAPCADLSCQVDDVISVPACGSLPGKLIVRLKATGAGQVKQMNARGGGTQEFPIGALATGVQVQLDNAGCVTRADPNGGAPTLRQVVTYHVGSLNLAGEFVAVATRAAYGCTATSCMGNELFPGAGVAFMTGSESRMVATFVDASGVVLTEVVMAPDTANRDLFVERSRSPAAGIPDRLVLGNYDTDEDTDLFWNISARRGTTFEVAYARKVGVQRLEALSAVQPITVTSIDTGDVTGDGFDDVVIIGDLGAAISGLVVIPMNAPASSPAIPTDATCSP